MTTTNTKKEVISKQQSRAFGKDVYLLGIDEDGTKYWLQAPKWDCGWYWGFGYVETYTNNNRPDLAKDINSHQHIDSSFLGKLEYYDTEKGCFRQGEYIHNIFRCPKLSASTFTESEGWTLTELFNTFYSLKESAELFGRGGSHTTTNPCKDTLLNKEWTNHINTVLIPTITSKIIEILQPK